MNHPQAFTLWGLQKICFLEPKQSSNSTWYIKVLDTQGLTAANETFDIAHDWILQNDGALCHTNKIVRLGG